MSNDIINELIKNRHLIINSQVAVSKPSQKRGSPLDRYRAEILFFRNEMQCSYKDISKWLSIHRNIQRSHTLIARKIKLWEDNNATKKNISKKKI